MTFPLVFPKRCFLIVLFVLFALRQAGAAEFHYYGLPLIGSYGIQPGTDNRITVHVAYDPNDPATTTVGSMSDGTHTISNGPNGNGGWLSCDKMQLDELGNPVVWRCTASISYNDTTLILQTNSVWGIYWVPLDESLCGLNWDWKNGGGGLAISEDFSMSAAPAAQSVKAGKTAQYQLTVQASAGLTPVLTCENVPAGSSCSITASAGGYTATVDTKAGKRGTPKGTYTVVFKGTTDLLVHDTSVSLIVK